MIRVYHADSCNMKEVETESIQLAISSPNQIQPIIRGNVNPSYQQTMESRKKYKKHFQNLSHFFQQLMHNPDALFNIYKEVERVIKPNGVFLMNLGCPHIDISEIDMLDFIFGSDIAVLYPYIMAEQIVWTTDLKLRGDIISEVIPPPLCPNPEKQFQHWFLFSKTDKWMQTPIQMPSLLSGTTKIFGQNKMHLQTFSEEILEILIDKYSNEGDWILDPGAGSGTLGLVGERKKRNTILYEIEEGRIEIIKERLKGLDVKYG